MLDQNFSMFPLNGTYLEVCPFIYDKQIAGHEISTLLIALINALSALVAVSGNALVLAAIWRNQSLRTPSYIFLAGLAVTDFATGLISQPLYTGYIFLRFTDKHMRINCFVITTADSLGRYFAAVTMQTITVMSVERWLHMSRRPLIAVRRVYIMYGVLVSFPIPCLVARLWLLSEESFRKFWEPFAIGLFYAVCFVITSISYFKVFRIIRLQQRQIQVNQHNQSFHAHPTITLKYKKSVYTVLYILILFLLCYAPHTIGIGVRVVLETSFTKTFNVLWHMSTTLIFMSSSLNPLLYCWRIKEIRDEAKMLIKKIICEG